MYPIVQLATETSVQPTLQRLKRLCLDDPNPRFLSDLLMFIGTRESAEILSEWASESDHAAGLERLARLVWADPALLPTVDPRRTTKRVEERYSPSERRNQFPAALAAARRPLPPNQMAHWIQRLRHYLLVRQLDALEEDFPREAHLHEVAVTVRDVCQMSNHPRLAWLMPLAGSSTDLIEFEAETIIRARQARRAVFDRSRTRNASDTSAAHAAKNEKAEVRFYDALLAVLEHKPWARMDLAGAQASKTGLTPYRSAAEPGSLAALIEKWRADPSPRPTQFGNPDQGGINLTSQSTSKRHSQEKKERLGAKVRLEHLAETLCLPHQWSATTEDEDDAIKRRIEELLESGPLQDRFGAACTLIARLAGVSMHDVETIPLVQSAAHAWHLNVVTGSLQRHSPRFERRWRTKGTDRDMLAWVKPLLEQWTFQLADKVISVVREATELAPHAHTLGAVWDRVASGTYIERWFVLRFAVAPGLTRLSSPNVGSALGLEVFRQTGDLAFARLVASDHRTALPAACTYGAFRASEVSAVLDQYARDALATLVQPEPTSDVNAAGSELDLNIARVAQALGGLTNRLDACATTGDWIRHHNLLTALVTLSLLASTGARPVNSPFESLCWFDLQRALLFVEDKVAGPTRGSRLCILSDFARHLLEQHYLPHLQRLTTSLKPHAPTFAAEIERVAAGDPEARVPLLFMLRDRPTLDWIEVSETQLDLVCGFDWPLPWNFLRHWMSTGLRRGGVCPDIRDALLGHADRNAEPHGDFSPRVPAADLHAARPVVNQMQSQLRWRAPAAVAGPAVVLSGLVEDTIEGRNTAFGRRARLEKRKQSHEKARTLAAIEIEAYFNGRTVDQLSSAELDELARTMLFRKSMPHVFASLRYEVFENVIREQWRKLGKQATATRRYVIAMEGEARFTDEALHAHGSLERARSAFEALVTSRPDRREGPAMADTLAAVDMVLYSKLAYLAPLTTLVTNSKTLYRLVRHQGRDWFEWGFGAEWHDGKPALRIEISGRAARWIAEALNSDRKLKETPALPSAMGDFAAAVAPSARNAGTLLRRLVEVQDQVNVFELPGYQAAFLAGRRASAALPHLDWIRLVSGSGVKRPTASTTGEGSDALDDADGKEALTYFRTHRRPSSVTSAEALMRCKALFDDISKVLVSKDPAEDELSPDSRPAISPGGGHDEGTEQNRKHILTNGKKASRIKRLVSASGFGHGAAPFLLAHFMVHVLTRPPKRGKADRLRGSTAYRYWMSLAGPFCDAVADKNFIAADEEDFTEWYAAIIDAWDSANASHPDEAKSPVVEPRVEARSDDTASDAPLRTMRQLVDFHQFMQDTYGSTDPDWAEVAPDLVAPVGRPGIILQREFHATLRRVIGDRSIDRLPSEALHRAFVLIVCYRFGLRTSEVLGLHREDWIDAGRSILVAVRSNRIRPLKTNASRRIVPLLESLTALEQGVISRVIEDWQRREGANARTPLLTGVRRETIDAVKASVGGALLGDLKAVTRNQGSTVHMLRHSFAMRMAARLMGLTLEPTDPSDLEGSVSLRKTLLGTHHLDRRALWAIARLLGHAAPTCTLLSYINCLHLWLPANTSPARAANDTAAAPLTTQCIDLDRYPRLGEDSAQVAASVQPAVVSAPTRGDKFLRGLEYLRFIAVGQTEHEAEVNARLPEGRGRVIGAALARVGERLSGSEKRYSGFKLLGNIGPQRIRALIDRVASTPVDARDEGHRVDDWLYTIGASRHVLGYQEEHFKAITSFLSAMDLSAQDVVLVHAKGVHPDLLAFASRAGLASFLVSTDQVPIGEKRKARAFQLDVARVGPRGTIEKERMVMVPRRGGVISDTHELATLWLMWNLSAL